MSLRNYDESSVKGNLNFDNKIDLKLMEIMSKFKISVWKVEINDLSPTYDFCALIFMTEVNISLLSSHRPSKFVSKKESTFYILTFCQSVILILLSVFSL